MKDGGADRNRTCDLLIANETLYQLSYDPIQNRIYYAGFLLKGKPIQRSSRRRFHDGRRQR